MEKTQEKLYAKKDQKLKKLDIFSIFGKIFGCFQVKNNR